MGRINAPSDSEIEKLWDSLYEIISAWPSRNKLTINPSKTEALFVPFREALRRKEIEMEGAPVSYSDNLEYLGFIFNSRLTWLDHIFRVRIFRE